MLYLSNRILTLTSLSALLLTGLGACTPNGQDPSYKIDEYFDLTGLINEEVEYFEANPPEAVRKTVKIESQSETKQEKLDSLTDIKAIIETANINKPGLRGVYTTDSTFEVQGTDTLYGTIVHKLKPDENALVEFIKLYYKGSPNKANLHKILVYKNRSNLLYQNAQCILVNFKANHLSSLALEGRQQILFFAPHSFRTDFQIIQ